jgi:hypothetical protein
MEISMEVPQKTKNKTTILSCIGIYPKESKSTYHRDTCTPVFIVALFTTAKLWNQSRYPSTDE